MRRRALKKAFASPGSRESSRQAGGHSHTQTRHAWPAGAGARADSRLHVLRAGVSASYGRGRKRKSALPWPPQQQWRHPPSPSHPPLSRTATEAALRRDPEPAPAEQRCASRRPAVRWGCSGGCPPPRPP